MGEQRSTGIGTLKLDSSERAHIMSYASSEDEPSTHFYTCIDFWGEYVIEPTAVAGLPRCSDPFKFFVAGDESLVLTVY